MSTTSPKTTKATAGTNTTHSRRSSKSCSTARSWSSCTQGGSTRTGSHDSLTFEATYFRMELIRSRGHPDTVQRRCSDGKDQRSVRAGVPAPDGVRVALVRAGRTPGELAREFERSTSAIRNWVHQADRDEGRREDGLTTAEREELRRLRRENRLLREEREILKKAAAWFARETGTVPGRSSSS